MSPTQLPSGLVDYVESAGIALTLADARDPEHPLILVNEPFLKLSGRKRDEVIGRNCRFLQGDRRDQEGLEKVRRFLASEEIGTIRVQLVNLRADGTPFINMLTLSRICDPENETCYLFASQFDIGAADAADAEDYEDELGRTRQYARDMLKPVGMQLMGSRAALADAALTIAQARIQLSRYAD
ncbi:PAS domain-containing protein [Sphingomicrobium sediminis]|uniref:PAS domain-containing protein n=1 Tax=Sphingomicrobium sediminis TaxID=2950949 RepID=A0A9X2J4H4_9SPHN|nr:PAS domain-containing protein [Sphingomicrobium sediminis]MCM8558371.1 PAS domain-containing protein [Sphingomicrobium sediminis]